MMTQRHLLSWLLLALYWLTLFILTHLPRVPSVHVIGRDLTLHVVVFFFLTLFWWIARYSHRRRPGITQPGLWLTLALIAAYGAIDEITQGFVGRHVSFYDWLADMSGCILALVLLALPRRPGLWLVGWWLALFVSTHFADRLLERPDALIRYEAAFLTAGYAILTILWFRWLGRDRFRWSWPWALGSALILSAYAILDETANLILNNRFELIDLPPALFGIALGITAALLLTCQQENPHLTPTTPS